MRYHIALGTDVAARRKQFRLLVREGKIKFGGNKLLKIYGALSCISGRRIHIANRVFFETEEEAIAFGYRPCGHCMKQRYSGWKAEQP